MTKLIPCFQDSRGSIFILFALCLALLVGVAGAGVGLGLKMHKRGQMQTASDAASASAAGLDQQDRVGAARRYFALNYEGTNTDVVPNVWVANDQVNVQATSSVKTYFVKTMGMGTLSTDSASAAAFKKAPKFDFIFLFEPIIVSDNRSPSIREMWDTTRIFLPVMDQLLKAGTDNRVAVYTRGHNSNYGCSGDCVSTQSSVKEVYCYDDVSSGPCAGAAFVHYHGLPFTTSLTKAKAYLQQQESTLTVLPKWYSQDLEWIRQNVISQARPDATPVVVYVGTAPFLPNRAEFGIWQRPYLCAPQELCAINWSRQQEIENIKQQFNQFKSSGALVFTVGIPWLLDDHKYMQQERWNMKNQRDAFLKEVATPEITSINPPLQYFSELTSPKELLNEGPWGMLDFDRYSFNDQTGLRKYGWQQGYAPNAFSAQPLQDQLTRMMQMIKKEPVKIVQ